ncbi:CotS family spore coat protein [Cohnella candidum]|uniref:CotS family spore coat protein n=1 Tax=Cohnella candidum TaxID=2674991 RepID=A0A3G3JY36_9BACL|nr:CotS family spore coat protein [Cohnella candidum]AYQ73164.1 CotS family spore coat protein [Cohnella candidum]
MTVSSAGDAIRVLEQYAVEVRNVRLVHAAESKAIWKVDASGGPLGLKRFKYGKDRMLFAIQAQKHLQDRGGPVPSVRLTRGREPFAENGGHVYMLYDWTTGRKPSFGAPADLRQAVRLLARFHAASAGFRPEVRCRESSKWGKWPEQYEAMEAHLRQWQEGGSDRKLESVLKPYWQDLIRIAGQARSELGESAYDSLVRSGSPHLCHQDFSEGNVLLHGEGGTVLDLDSVTYDFPARDLRKLILKRMQVKGRWDPELFARILKWYNDVHPLGGEQTELLRIDLLFPHLFHETAKNPYRNGSPVPAAKLLTAVRIERGKAADLFGL